MGLANATMNDTRATRARISIPAWGCWYADVSLDGEVSYAAGAPAKIKIADLTLAGTVLSGGPAKGRSDYRVVAGKGGWGKTLPSRSYANDAGVRTATVIGDAAEAAGETLAAISRTLSVGPAYVRPEGPAAQVLAQLAPKSWYVDEGGTTRLGKRAPSKLSGAVTHGPVDLARKTVTLAAESIAAILPGLLIDGLEAVDVQHTINAKDGLRSTIWGARNAGTSRRLGGMMAVLDALDPDRAFRGVVEYRVVTQAGERLNLQPIRVSTGMPNLARVVVRPGVSGVSSQVMLGSRVLVGFVDSDPARPCVLAFEDAEGEGFTPLMTHIDALLVRLGAGVRPVIGAGDLAVIFPCIPTQVQVLV